MRKSNPKTISFAGLISAHPVSSCSNLHPRKWRWDTSEICVLSSRLADLPSGQRYLVIQRFTYQVYYSLAKTAEEVSGEPNLRVRTHRLVPPLSAISTGVPLV